MYTKFVRVWESHKGQDILKLNIFKIWTAQNRKHHAVFAKHVLSSENKNNALGVWGRYSCSEILQQHARKGLDMQNRLMHYSELQVKNKKFPYNSLTKPISIGSDEEKQEYISAFPVVVETMVNAATDIPELKERYRTLLYENVPKEKQGSGFLTVAAYKMFEAPENLTPENVKLANILGWCATLHFCAFLIADDMMDASLTRCGKPCWYKRNNVGMEAVNDAILMLDGIYLVLRKHFSEHQCHYPAVEWFHDVTMKFAVGQSLDNMYSVSGKPRLDSFTMSKYKSLARYKGTYPSYLLPATLGLYLAGKYDIELHRKTNDVLSEVGFFFITQNDILDCYGDPAVTGKIGNDIREGKCTWLIVKALQRATPSQQKILSEHYGRPEYKSELEIRTVYEELGLLEEFLIYEKKSFNKVSQIIQEMPKEMGGEFFNKIIEATYESN